MTMSLCRHDKSIINNRVRRSMSSSECRRREVTARMWHAAEDCSKSKRRRLEKLGRCRLTVGYGEQTAHEMKRNADAFETTTLLDDEVHQRDMTVPGREDIYKQEWPAWILSAKRPSASEVGIGAAWCDRTLMTRRRAVRPRSLTASAEQGVLECRPVGLLRCNNPAAIAADTTPGTGRQS